MKYLDVDTLSRLSNFLDHVDCGDYLVSGNLEAYSCKLAGFDKKLSRSLDRDVELSCSPLELSKSPVGPLAEQSSRKTLIYLILTLNHIYPDYDFSLLRAHHFRKEEGTAQAEELVDNQLLEVQRVWESTPGFGDQPFIESVWNSIDEAVTLQDCDVYSYNANGDADPFGEKGSVWSFNYFFYNKKLKRIVYFSCRGFSKNAVEDDVSDTDSEARFNDDDEYDYGMAGEMDI